jgi:hypothetical protein
MVENISWNCRSGHSLFDILAEEQTSSLRRPVMNRVNRQPEQATQSELERVIEPLASYICATDRPRAALMSALAVLFSEVDRTSRAATAQIATFSGNRCS